MNNLFINSAYFGLVLTLGTYMLGVWIKKKTGLAIMNPLLVSTAFVIAFFLLLKLIIRLIMKVQNTSATC